ncbi:transporter [Ganoderma sinense ZZ0214-1]|uniref:Transporter n=1 Tax=Ganoderma sinense ZZ0214-1 TaxID=1077348 RepID=A0A2G8S8F7_9APHY|nr:transporter [Ganoderma sinense ZZ0214-1]
MLILRWQVLLISTRNSPNAISHLVQTTHCAAVLVDATISHLHGEVLRELVATGVAPTIITRAPIPSETARDGADRALAFLAESRSHSAAVLEREAKEGALYLHTSGTTGHPKAIAWSHEFLLGLCAANYRDRARCEDDLLYTCFPMFHSVPFFLGSGASFVCLDTWRSVSAHTVLRHLRALKHRKVDVSLPPSILEDIVDSRDPDWLRLLASQNTVFWGGAPLREDAGGTLCSMASSLSLGAARATEAGPLARSSLEANADPADWMYMRLVDYYQSDWYQMEDDVHGRYNLIISPIHTTPPVVNTLDPIGFATVDGWLKHPDPNKAHLWRPAGRLDDVTVLSNGENTDNTQLETLLCTSPYIQQAIIFGTGKFVNGALVNPPPGLLKSDDDEHLDHYLDLIWPHIEDRVNKIIPCHSRLLRGMVLVARSDRPFLFSDKGTVKNRATLALYTSDVDSAYAALERGTDVTATSTSTSTTGLPLGAGLPAPLDESEIRGLVDALVADAVEHRLGPEDNLFRNGMDSFGATRLRAVLSAALRRTGILATVPRNVVYAHPTRAALSRFLVAFTAAGTVAEKARVKDDLEAEISQMVDKYSKDLPEHEGACPLPSDTDGDVYAVTGTTGSLGATFMALLLEQPHIKKVYALNRSHGSQLMESRQEAAFMDKGLDLPLLQEAVRVGRVEFVEFEAGKDHLGVEDEVYSKLTQELTHIVHIAWLLNFDLPLSHFEPHVAGVRAVLELALSSLYSRPPYITFVSSIGTTARWPFPERPVPKVALNSPEFCIPQGYSYAKYVSEQVIQHAVAQRPTLCAAVIRCGQLSGALATGAWQRSEYIPRLLRSAHKLGMVPTDATDVRWLPVDVAADILLREIEHAALHPAPGPVRYYTLDTTQFTPWQRVVDALAAFAPDREWKKVTMSAFLAEVRKDPTSPAFAVAEYLEDLLVSRPIPMLSVTQARRAAGSLVDCEIYEETLISYVRYACS